MSMALGSRHFLEGSPRSALEGSPRVALEGSSRSALGGVLPLLVLA